MSGGSNKAAKEASKAEEARTARIAATQGRVNQVFDSPQRAADIADVVNAVRQYSTADLDRQKTDNDRQLRFSLARGGLTGGSTNRDLQAEQGRTYARALLGIEGKAQEAGSSLQSADQQARAQLISLATSGLDATSAARQASEALQTNLQAAKAGAMAGTLNDSFSAFKTSFDRMRELSDRRRADLAAGITPYKPINYGGNYGG